MKYLRENYHSIEDGIEEIEQSSMGYSHKIKVIETYLGIIPDYNGLS